MNIRLALLLLIGMALVVAGCGEGVELQDASTTSGSSSKPAVEPPAGPLPAKVTLDLNQQMLTAADGRQVDIAAKVVTGYVDNAVVNGDYLDMSGWAAPIDLSRPTSMVVAMAGNRSVAIVAPSRERPDLVEGYDRPGLANAGFVMSIPRNSLDCSKPDQGLKTYGVTRKGAGELEWLADVPEIVKEAC